MLIMYRSIRIWAPSKGPEGREHLATLWHIPGGLKPGQWCCQIGSGQTNIGSAGLVLQHLNSKLSLEPKEVQTLISEMRAIDVGASIAQCSQCGACVDGPQWGMMVCAKCSAEK